MTLTASPSSFPLTIPVADDLRGMPLSFAVSQQGVAVLSLGAIEVFADHLVIADPGDNCRRLESGTYDWTIRQSQPKAEGDQLPPRAVVKLTGTLEWGNDG